MGLACILKHDDPPGDGGSWSWSHEAELEKSRETSSQSWRWIHLQTYGVVVEIDCLIIPFR